MTENIRHEMTNGRLGAAVLAQGAELCSFHDTDAGELLWQAGPIWPHRSPVLFPIVGRLRNDTLRHEDRLYHLTQHGFARDRRFTWIAQDATSCSLVLEDDAVTRALFPFAFRLELRYALTAGGLDVRYRVTNTGSAVLPASLGAHPAFRWPLAPGAAPDAHRVEFAAEEPAPIRRLAGGLLRAAPVPTPIRGRVLPLERALFADDAVILDRPASHSLQYRAPGTRGIEISWDGFTQLGLWSREGGDFLCIEPWHGIADQTDFDGAFMDKPGLMLIAPGETRDLAWTVRVVAG
jgi:galactose mutarotase-like enzyme